VACHGGPKVSPDGLVFSLDVANRKCISPLGCTGFNGAPQLVKNLVSPTDVIIDANGVRLGNLTYYTAFAIDYPESSFGGSAANRDGITPGYNVTSGTKTFDFGRALNYAVYNNPTQSWVKTTVYDSYVGTAAVDTFVSEYATAVATYPDAIHIVAGSHRDSFHTTAQYNILKDLGAPSNVDSIINFSSPEWILIGKPGLGAGNAYGWVFQNYTTNPDQVAHLNFGLPIYGGVNNYLEFDGVNDGVQLPGTNLSLNQMTISSWNFSSNYVHNGFMFEKTTNGSVNTQYSLFFNNNTTSNLYYRTYGLSTTDLIVSNANSGVVNNSWNNVVATWDGTNKRIYVNGILRATSANLTGTVTQNSTGAAYIGIYGNFAGYPFNGRISQTQIYNRALTASEIQQNFNAKKSRFGL
jgi:hypothetical protein